jgi:hypothetical protein
LRVHSDGDRSNRSFQDESHIRPLEPVGGNNKGHVAECR